MPIQHIKRKDIDTNKWDALVEQYAQGLPYAYSWYLDAVCDKWSVLIEDDYKAGMAFQIKKKKGLPYSLQPFLTQQLGFLGDDPETHKMMIKQLQRNVFYINHHFNFFNKPDLKCEEKINHELPLKSSYTELSKNYKTNTKRNLKKADLNTIAVTISNAARPEDVEFIFKHSKIEFNDIRKAQCIEVLKNASKHHALEIYKAEMTKEILALVIFIRTKLRSVYLIAASQEKGLHTKANFLLVDTFIKNNAESDMILDFEGSSIEGISRFYKGFGAQENNYALYKAFSLKNIFGKLF